MENGERRKGREEPIFSKSCACIVRISIETTLGIYFEENFSPPDEKIE